MQRRTLLVLCLIATALLTGCYASTEPASNVGTDSATLNARGTANKGDAQSWFEYEISGRVGDPQHTTTRFWPAGASAPFNERVSGLAANTEYSFRVCGQDSSTPRVCAQTRTFTTKPPVMDEVRGSFFGGCCNSFGVPATSGPSGENPQGTLSWTSGSSFDPVSRGFTGRVTCLQVDGSRAAVVAVGTMRTDPGGEETPMVSTAIVLDGRAREDKLLRTNIAGTTAPACSTVTGTPTETISPEFDFIVNDARPAAAAR
jgi:hypothetical protein